MFRNEGCLSVEILIRIIYRITVDSGERSLTMRTRRWGRGARTLIEIHFVGWSRWWYQVLLLHFYTSRKKIDWTLESRIYLEEHWTKFSRLSSGPAYENLWFLGRDTRPKDTFQIWTFGESLQTCSQIWPPNTRSFSTSGCEQRNVSDESTVFSFGDFHWFRNVFFCLKIRLHRNAKKNVIQTKSNNRDRENEIVQMTTVDFSDNWLQYTFSTWDNF